MAPASAGAGHHVRGFSGARAGRTRLGALAAEPRLVQRAAVLVSGPVDRAVLDRLHIDGAGQCLGCARQRIAVQHRRGRADSVARRAADEHQRRRSDGRHRDPRHRAAAVVAVRGGPIAAALDRRLDCPARPVDQSRRSRIDPVDRVHRVLDGHGGAHLAQRRSVATGRGRRRQHGAVDGGAGLHLSDRSIGRTGPRRQQSCCCSAVRKRAWRPAFRWRWCSSRPPPSA